MKYANHLTARIPMVRDLSGKIHAFNFESPISHDLTSLSINQSGWNFSSDNINASVLCGHDGQNFGLIFLVEEPNTLGTKLKDFEPVYEDSCVEFFFRFNENEYWNFEFNCLGSCLCARGPNRENRHFLDPEILASVYRKPFFPKKSISIIGHQTQWYIKLILPLGKWLDTPLGTISIPGNFYKCGDKLLNPHYLSWNKIETPKPDFHRPEYFGSLIFE